MSDSGRHRKRGFFRRHWVLSIFVVLIIAVGSIVSIVVTDNLDQAARSGSYQHQIASFYRYPPALLKGKPGSLIRTQPVAFAPKGSRGWRVLYRSQGLNGQPTISSGLVFVPDGPAPKGGRPVVAWAHGTIGMGNSCAPSRSLNHLADMDWLAGMLARGWVVTATDYSGLGTRGTLPYLIGSAEAKDVLNSVRVARQMRETDASNRFALWGHSQGGQSALFAAQQAARYVPELKLVSTAVAAPAAELVPLMRQQYDTPVAWGIGPEVAVAWPVFYKGLDVGSVLSPPALKHYREYAQLCIVQASLRGLARQKLLGQRFFAENPVEQPAWRKVMRENTVPNTPQKMPVMVAQGLADTVVLPNTTALLAKRYCSAKRDLTMYWMRGVGHPKAAIIAGPRVTQWLSDRFAGRSAGNTCRHKLPVKPASD